MVLQKYIFAQQNVMQNTYTPRVSKMRCVAKIHFCVHFAVQNVYKCIFAQQLTTILFRKMCGNVWLQETFLIIKKSK